MYSIMLFLFSRTPFLTAAIEDPQMRGNRDRRIGFRNSTGGGVRTHPDDGHGRQIELIGLDQLDAIPRAWARGRDSQTDKQDKLIEDFVREILRTGEHLGKSKLFPDWSLVSQRFKDETAHVAIRATHHGVLQVRSANSLEASVTHAKRIGRSVFDPRVHLFSANVFGQPQVVAVHYENRAVCSVRIASDFERLALGNRRVRQTGRALMQHGWRVHNHPEPDSVASESSRFGLAREFDPDELSEALLTYVSKYVR
ncbi:hypothetical protein [Paraburkholderia sp. CI3]|uniref:hypothetical protein n=1 Tax=Paraburkholderia sp. CI3 TaxID=2991060 RepID=UPI003D2507EC